MSDGRSTREETRSARRGQEVLSSGLPVGILEELAGDVPGKLLIRPCHEVPLPQKVTQEAHPLADLEADECQPDRFAGTISVGRAGGVDTEQAKDDVHARGEANARGGTPHGQEVQTAHVAKEQSRHPSEVPEATIEPHSVGIGEVARVRDFEGRQGPVPVPDPPKGPRDRRRVRPDLPPVHVRLGVRFKHAPDVVEPLLVRRCHLSDGSAGEHLPC